VAYTCGLGFAQALLGMVVALARRIDGVCYPELKNAPVPAPLFVLATPRSGTTFLHDLLALDEERFLPVKLYQTIAPSVLLERAIEGLRDVGGPFGRALALAVDAVDRRIFTDWDGIHRVSLGSAEEDENLFVYSLTSPALYLLFPFVRELPEFVDITRLGRRAVRKVARDYRETVQRWVYQAGAERTPLIKNVLLASRLPVSDRAFPEARYVHVLRDPREAIPSALSMFYAMWRTHSPSIAPDSPSTRALADMFLEHYRMLCEEGERRAPDHWFTLRYEALIGDPVASVERIYAAFGWPVRPSFRTRLEQAAADARNFKSRHRYDLGHFGLDEDVLRAGLGAHFSGAAPSFEPARAITS
jgi:LPS sulfotransferase NodH